MAPKTQIAGEEEPPAKVAKTSHEGPLQSLASCEHWSIRHQLCTVLMGLSDAGLQFLVAASRANVGVKSGRYMFEVRVVEVLLPTMPGGRMAPLQPIPRQQKNKDKAKAILPSATAQPSAEEDSVCFDSDGCFINFINNKTIKTNVAERFVRDNVFGVLLNLDPASPHANTISLFKDGRRVSKPQPLPEGLVGHALFPHVSFRNVTLQVHFGPGLIAPEAAKEDAVIASSSFSQDGKFEILFPIALPDEGTFDWLDDFLENHPGYTEVSDRKIVEWATGSGLGKPRTLRIPNDCKVVLMTTSLKNSNDKPDITFGIQALDEMTPRKLLYTIAPLIPRNYVVMEVKSNLLKSERQDLSQMDIGRYWNGRCADRPGALQGMVFYSSSISCGKRWPLALELLRFTAKLGRAPNTVCCNAAIGVCEKMSKWQQAIAVMRHMPLAMFKV
eukprot:s2363_g7.t1